MTDVDLRKIRYFVAVAEALSFRRAAEQLHIAQPVLSRQIQVLERELRTKLFDRGPRGTTLTGAGAQLLADAPVLLAASGDVVARAQAAARPARRLLVGVMPGLVVTTAATELEHRHPGVSIEVRRTSWQTQVRLVRDRTLDLSVVREPFSADGLRSVLLTEEPRVAALPASSDLAGQPSIDIAETAKLLLLQDPAVVPEWAAVASPALVRRADRGETPSTVEDKLEGVASGRGFVVLPESTAAFYRHPGVVTCALAGVRPSVVSAVARPTSDPLVDELMDLLRATSGRLTGH